MIQPSSSSEPALALVLGATGGLGSAYCRSLAARQVNLIVSGRNLAALQKLQSELTSAHPIKVEIQLADLSSNEDVDRIMAIIESRKEVNWLINAAGTAQWGQYRELATENELSVCEMNLLLPMRLIRKSLAAFEARRGGTIVHVASAAAFFTLPFLSAYCAAKTAIVQWMRSIECERYPSSVRLQALCPGFVKTDMFMKAGADADRLPKWIWMSPERVVRESLNALSRQQLICIPGRRYRLMIFGLKWVPASISIRVAGRMFGNFSKYRISANRLP